MWVITQGIGGPAAGLPTQGYLPSPPLVLYEAITADLIAGEAVDPPAVDVDAALTTLLAAADINPA